MINLLPKMLKITGKYIKPLFLMVILLFLVFPNSALFKDFESIDKIGPVPEEAISAYYDGPTLPEIPERSARYAMVISVTAYNSLPEQTDDTPFITASNTHTRDGIVAANFLPFGTLVRIPEIYGNKIFIVEDRMNSKYHYHMDIWMEHYQDAIDFGLKALKIEVL